MTHEEEIELGKELALYAADPLKFALDMFPWDSHPELKGAAPEKWQREVLEAIRDGLPQEKVRIACASGHGVGKNRVNIVDYFVGVGDLQRYAGRADGLK